MSQVDFDGPQGERLLGDPAQIHLRRLNTALRHPAHAQDLVIAAQAQDVDQLISGAVEIGSQLLLRFLLGVDDGGAPGAGFLVALGHCGEHPEKDRRMTAHPLDLAQLLHRCVQHTGQTAEMLDQGVGQVVHIPLGDGEKQGKLQNAVVRPALHAAGEKFLLHPAPVAGVDRFSHVSPPLRTGPGRPPCGLFAPGRPELR